MTVGRASGLVGVSGTVVTGGVVSTVRVGATVGADVSTGAVVEVSGVVGFGATSLVVVPPGEGGVSMYAGSFDVRFTLGGATGGASTNSLIVEGGGGVSGCSAA